MAEHAAVAPAATGGDDESTTDGGSVVSVLTIMSIVFYILIRMLNLHTSVVCILPLRDHRSYIMLLCLLGSTLPSLTDSMAGSVS